MLEQEKARSIKMDLQKKTRQLLGQTTEKKAGVCSKCNIPGHLEFECMNNVKLKKDEKTLSYIQTKHETNELRKKMEHLILVKKKIMKN